MFISILLTICLFFTFYIYCLYWQIQIQKDAPVIEDINKFYISRNLLLFSKRGVIFALMISFLILFVNQLAVYFENIQNESLSLYVILSLVNTILFWISYLIAYAIYKISGKWYIEINQSYIQIKTIYDKILPLDTASKVTVSVFSYVYRHGTKRCYISKLILGCFENYSTLISKLNEIYGKRECDMKSNS